MDYGRLMVAMVTPFRANMTVDFERAGLLAKKLVAEGVTSILVTGTTGESPTVSREEKIELIKAVKAAVSVPVMGNAGTNDTAASIQYAKDARAAGADGILLVVPYYNKPDQDMLYDHFAAIARSVDIPSMIYNVPSRTGVGIKPETVVKLSRNVPTIDSVKEASGDLDALTFIVNEAAPGFRSYTGEDALTLPSLAIGAYGAVSVAGHVVAPLMSQMIEAYLKGDVPKAALIHGKLRDINKALFMQPNPVPVKMALRLCGFDVGALRPPLKEASAAVTEALKAALSALGLLK